jgi:S-adenosylmethionine-dependent methyltransferase
MITVKDDERFQKEAHEYAAYLETFEGRLRTDLAFANLQEFLPSSLPERSVQVLDVGGGTGAAAVQLARLGCDITLLDSSQAMLDLARLAAQDAGVPGRVTLRHGDASELSRLFPAASFDVVICHNVLEFVHDPSTVLRGMARALRDGSATLSIVVRNQAGEVFKAAIRAGNLAAAKANLTSEWGVESLYGGSVRLFSLDCLHRMLDAESLTPIAERGIRVVADYLPPSVSRQSDYSRIHELEKTLGSRPAFAPVARYTHCLARRMEKNE